MQILSKFISSTSVSYLISAAFFLLSLPWKPKPIPKGDLAKIMYDKVKNQTQKSVQDP